MSNMKPIHKVINYLLREQLPDDPNKEATHSMCKFYSADPDREGSGRCSKFNSYVQGAEAVCGSYESEGSDESESVIDSMLEDREDYLDFDLGKPHDSTAHHGSTAHQAGMDLMQRLVRHSDLPDPIIFHTSWMIFLKIGGSNVVSIPTAFEDAQFVRIYVNEIPNDILAKMRRYLTSINFTIKYPSSLGHASEVWYPPGADVLRPHWGGPLHAMAHREPFPEGLIPKRNGQMKEAVKAKHLQFVIDGKYSVVTTTDWLKRKGWLNAGVTLVRLEWDRDGDGKLVTVAGPPSVLDRMKYEVGGRIVIPDRYESKVTDVISSLLED